MQEIKEKTIIKDKQFYIDCFVGWCKRRAGFVQRFANYNEYFQEGIYDIKIPNVGSLRVSGNMLLVFEKSKYVFETVKPKEFLLSTLERDSLYSSYVDGIKEEHLKILKNLNETIIRQKIYHNPQFQRSIFDFFHNDLPYKYRILKDSEQMIVFSKQDEISSERRKFKLTKQEINTLESYL